MQTLTSQDGTTIAFDKTGTGPAVILVAGATATRDGHTELAQLLSSDFTVYNYDRRGRGDSTDTAPFTLQKEIEDIEALINDAGGSAFLHGISSGGALALEATIALKEKVKKLSVYEIPYDESEAGIAAWHEYTTAITTALKENRRGDAIAAFMKFVGVPDENIAGMRMAPFWAGMEAIAPTLLYDAAALGEDRLVPTDRVKDLQTPTLVLDGGGNLQMMPFMNISAKKLTAALPHAEHQTLEGQTHDVNMKTLAPVLATFFKG